VLYNLAITGEAARKTPEEVKNRYPEIPGRAMGDMWKVVIHEYFGIDMTILWETLKHELPPLTNSLRNILEQI
jgi:uncharacterized protein with HEPN domain